MSCYGCARGFGLLTKEHGCEKCGFSFCSKCLVNKMCKSCTTKKSAVTPIPPVVLQERLEKLENPNRNPVIVYTDNPHITNLKRGLSVEDQELVNRLSKLKNDIREMKSIPTQDEIEERLAKLKGIDPQVYKKPTVFSKPKSNVDEATDLINQMSEEVAIDGKTDSSSSTSFPMQQEEDVEMLLQREALSIQREAQLGIEGLKKDQEIQERLKKLRLDREKTSPQISIETLETKACPEVDMDSEDEDQAVRKIIERAMDEERLELEGERTSGDGAEEEELPWCALCNEDAHLRCFGCDNDLYCRRCWKEFHQDPDEKRHRTENYKAPK